jgi:NAD(P)-dependent dehydrogenase (short-subunit alcohol dehydrogenase family)
MELGLLEGKVAVVTGGGQGIGMGIARRFAHEGAAVVIAELDETHGARVAEDIAAAGGKALFCQTDVSQKEDVFAVMAQASEHFGRLDVLVNNAVKLPVAVAMEEKTDEMLKSQLAIGVWGSWWGMQAALPLMRASGGGSIINMTSIDVESGGWLHADYAVAKAGIAAMTRAAAVDWGRYNVRVNAIAPSAVSSAFHQMAKERPGVEEMAKRTRPLFRLGDPENDIGPVVVMLASDATRYVTGTTIPVDGGKHVPRGGGLPPFQSEDAK